VSRNSAILGPARNHLCVRCGRPAASWHHRLPEGRGGPTDGWNCVPLCGDGTRGCHGWVEHHPAEARAVFLAIPGTYGAAGYVGPDPGYRWHYNGQRWSDTHGWVDAYGAAPDDVTGLATEVWT